MAKKHHLPARLAQLAAEQLPASVQPVELPPTPFHNEYLPTADEIRQGCLNEQKEWTDAEWRRRGGDKGIRKKVEIQEVKVHARLQ